MHVFRHNTSVIIAALLGVGINLPAIAADISTTTNERLEAMEKRIQILESENTRLKKSLTQPYISDSEPEISARLKAIESQVYSYRKAARTVESLDGIKAGVGLTMALQRLSAASSSSEKSAELNYRGDVSVSLPAGNIGASEGFIFTHFRMGQGLGLENPGSAFSSFNSTSFQRPGTVTADSTVLLAQAWYQLNIPLPPGGNPDLSRQHLELNFGKIDPFIFFDQNSIADDETRGFMNQAFVHNPLLDVGSDIGVDDFGFSPGLRLAWFNDNYRPQRYGLSMGIFGSGKGAQFEASLSKPFMIVQAETGQRFFGGLEANYRLYYWRNGRGKDLDGRQKTHTGFGLSLDQKVADYTTVFARFGQQFQGRVKFDRALTVGADFGGSYWRRGGDTIGLALGWLTISKDYQAVSNSSAGFNTSGSEQIAEIFYRYRINSQFELSPNLQHIRQPGGNQTAPGMTAYGLRVQLNY
ncbi:MAG TPA: carbohydrate porin [Gammaproteobacteria bacterium]|nr:carbohydrate porin [Gammaproteobacteria bacterium]